MSHDPALVERCAEAAYESTIAPGIPHESWANLHTSWQKQFRRQTIAVLDIAIPQPDPTPVNDPGHYDTDLFGGAA